MKTKFSILAFSIFALSQPQFFCKPDNDDSGGASTGTDAGNATGTAEPPDSTPSGPVTAAEFMRAHPIVETFHIELRKLVIDAGTQPRVSIDDEVVKDYAETIKQSIKDEQPNPFEALPDDKLPQVFRDGTGKCVLADGFHRYGGHKGAHAKEMKVAVRNGTAADALKFSLSTNQDHGLKRTNKDKARAVKIALNDPDLTQWANTEIARLCGVSEFMVRDLRPAAKSPTQRTVQIRGKKTTMKTGAIGKGKGGGAKGAKAKAKASGKAAPAAAATPAADPAVEADKLARKIADAVGGTAGGEIRKAINDGSLALSARELRDWAGMDAKQIKRTAPLVTGGSRMKPTKAFDFITSEVSPKALVEFENRAIADGGKFEYETDTLRIVVTRKKPVAAPAAGTPAEKPAA